MSNRTGNTTYKKPETISDCERIIEDYNQLVQKISESSSRISELESQIQPLQEELEQTNKRLRTLVSTRTNLSKFHAQASRIMKVLKTSEEQKSREINSAIAFAEYSVECLNYITEKIRSAPRLVQTILGIKPDGTYIHYNFCVSDAIRNLILYDVNDGDNMCEFIDYLCERIDDYITNTNAYHDKINADNTESQSSSSEPKCGGNASTENASGGNASTENASGGNASDGNVSAENAGDGDSDDENEPPIFELPSIRKLRSEHDFTHNAIIAVAHIIKLNEIPSFSLSHIGTSNNYVGLHQHDVSDEISDAFDIPDDDEEAENYWGVMCKPFYQIYLNECQIESNTWYLGCLNLRYCHHDNIITNDYEFNIHEFELQSNRANESYVHY